MGASGKMSRQHGGQRCGFASVLGAACLLVSLSPIPAADGGDSTPEVEIKIDPAQAQTAFVTAQKDLKDAVGELTVLQAEYQQPNSDKPAVEAKFNAMKERAQLASERLKTAAFALAMVDPTNKAAGETCGAVVAAALQSDDPTLVLSLAGMLDKAGAASGEVMMMATTAAMMLSQIDEATAWLKKAAANGAEKSSVAELTQALEVDQPKVVTEMAKRKAEAEADDLPRVKITTSKGEIVIELFENEAPNAVANFISLVEKGFYNTTPFHRVIGGFMAQGGDPTGSGKGGPGYVIDCEVDGPDARQHFLGSLSMAHAGKNTGGSQFFLTFRPTQHLDGKHTVFGRVIEGFAVLPKLSRTEGPLAGGAPDTIIKAEVLRKRNHPYVPKTRPR
jgi:cyclophilin family peptidyl-prolyl cis-trans isomerase